MAFLDSSLVALRESLEAFLIIGILAGIVRKMGAPSARGPILWGAVAGVALSVVAGILAGGIAQGLYSQNEALFEGVASLLAVAILTYMVIWMYRHTKEMVGKLHTKTKEALRVGSPWMLAGLSFVAVFREGIETVLFTAGKVPVDGVATTILAIAAGIAVSAVLAFLVFAGVVRMSIEGFMAVTGLVLIFVAGGLLGYGLHEIAEAGEHAAEGVGPAWLAPLAPLAEVPKAYDFSASLPHKPVGEFDTWQEGAGSFLHASFGYRANPTWAEVGAYLAYVGGMLVWYLRGVTRHRKALAAIPPTPPPAAAGPAPAVVPRPTAPTGPRRNL